MRTETRKVTVEQEVYIAEDGKEFDNDGDCECYEARLAGKRLKMYTHKYTKTDTVEDCYLVKLNSWVDAEDFIKLCRLDGFSANIYKSRKNHKLDEWHVFCDWIEGLPYSELITGGTDDE